MDKQDNKLITKLNKCRQTINIGFTNPKQSNLAWLNTYCAEFLDFTNDLHQFLANEFDKTNIDGNESVETTYLCLTQIVTCIKHLESTIKGETASGVILASARQHFLERINWCLKRLRDALKNLTTNTQLSECLKIEENSFVELMDLVLDQIAPYSTFKNENDEKLNKSNEIQEAVSAVNHIRVLVDIILSHTLAFANVALKEDKKAISALCQKVLRECMSFQEECSLNAQNLKCNHATRKLKAMALENALYQLEDYINEALLRLVYTCFLDFEKISIDKLRTLISLSTPEDEHTLDELIADFDVNIDRTTQIGIFAIAFAPNLKMKTIVRSCLASFESLDTCIIPALQTKNPTNLFAEILEQHYNEEIVNFKAAVQEIVDSYAFTACYYDMLTQFLHTLEKIQNKELLQDFIQMGQLLLEHFKLKVNQKELKRRPACQEQYEKFVMILQECQAILMCAEQVKPERVIKRFKILRAVLRKFLELQIDGQTLNNVHKNKASPIILLSDELSDSQRMFESIGISPSIRSILYRQETPMTTMRRRATSDSLKANYSKLPVTPTPVDAKKSGTTELKFVATEQRASIRRKESLRTAMFKRQKSMESEKAYKLYRNQSDSMQISEILDQLTGLSSHLSTITQLNDTLASK